jgi:hypothetical protein
MEEFMKFSFAVGLTAILNFSTCSDNASFNSKDQTEKRSGKQTNGAYDADAVGQNRASNGQEEDFDAGSRAGQGDEDANARGGRDDSLAGANGNGRDVDAGASNSNSNVDFATKNGESGNDAGSAGTLNNVNQDVVFNGYEIDSGVSGNGSADDAGVVAAIPLVSAGSAGNGKCVNDEEPGSSTIPVLEAGGDAGCQCCLIEGGSKWMCYGHGERSVHPYSAYPYCEAEHLSQGICVDFASDQLPQPWPGTY